MAAAGLEHHAANTVDVEFVVVDDPRYTRHVGTDGVFGELPGTVTFANGQRLWPGQLVLQLAPSYLSSQETVAPYGLLLLARDGDWVAAPDGVHARVLSGAAAGTSWRRREGRWEMIGARSAEERADDEAVLFLPVGAGDAGLAAGHLPLAGEVFDAYASGGVSGRWRFSAVGSTPSLGLNYQTSEGAQGAFEAMQRACVDAWLKEQGVTRDDVARLAWERRQESAAPPKQRLARVRVHKQ